MYAEADDRRLLELIDDCDALHALASIPKLMVDTTVLDAPVASEGVTKERVRPKESLVCRIDQ